jgi:protein O-GlcNAc transferase
MQTTVQDAFALAAQHEAGGRPADARAIYEQILAAMPEHPGALLRIAEQEIASGGIDAGQALLARALTAAAAHSLPSHEIWLVAGHAHFARGDREAAIAAVAQAMSSPPSSGSVAQKLGELARDAGGSDVAEQCFRAAAEHEAARLHALGKAQKAAGALVAARSTLEQCAELAPDDAEVIVTLGAICLELDDAEQARRHFERAIELGARQGELWDNLGLACRALGDEEGAAAAFERALQAAPTLTPAMANLVYTQQYLCGWDALESSERRLTATLADPSSDPRWPPFVALAMPLAPAQQLEVARRWSRAMLPTPVPRRPPPPRAKRLRLGYLSGSFHEHPTARLMVRLFEAHDRKRFEVTGYSYGPDDGSALRARVRVSFEHWRDVRELSDADIARVIRDDGIDLLIERKGHTHGGRLGILAQRPAAVQIHYMSFPGTLGYDAVDGVIADAEVVPQGAEGDFHERVWRLPRCYYVNDNRRGVPRASSRRENSLPDDALVLACLNQSYKLRRPFFAAWMEALRAQSDAVLWLLGGHPRAQANLRAEAGNSGVDPSRLIFARPAAQDAHLARVGCADLALDTLPYGAHTTGIDALWAGVPMLTCRGDTFAGRVGASLLLAAGLPELVANSLDDYRARLLALAADRATLRGHRAYLEASRDTNPLFDTTAFARDWETLLLAICDDAARVGV